MGDLFSKRMNILLKNGSLGAKLVNDSNIIESKTFSNDQNFRSGYIYDWSMNKLDFIDFKFEKIKTYSAEGVSIEYMVHFNPNFNPEFKYKDIYYRDDGRERLGFYIDVFDMSKDLMEKWLIIGKDDRVSFDRYNVFKCDWCFEWMADNQYHKCIGCVRDANDSSLKQLSNNALGGTYVNGNIAIIVPSNKDVSTITIGTRFMISDNMNNPRAFEVVGIKDTNPLGISKIYLKQCLINEHTDAWGIINNMNNSTFYFELPIDDLPNEFGGKYHMICDCLKSKGASDNCDCVNDKWKIECKDKYLYINGQSVNMIAKSSSNNDSKCIWHIYIDDVEYNKNELADYFDIYINETTLSIKAINKVMVKYIVKIVLGDNLNISHDFVELKVVL